MVSISFGPWWEYVDVRLSLCRGGPTPELAAVDLRALGDLPTAWKAFPAATGSVFVRQGAADELEFAFDLQSAGARFRANAVVNLADCGSTGGLEVDDQLGQPLPDCSPDAAR